MVPTVPVQQGLRAEVELVVGEADTAISLRSGDVPVLGTPRVLALCEEATMAAIEGQLPEGQTTVGMRAHIDHLAPTAVGSTVLEAAATTAKRVHLELGGKAPFVVLGDADLDAAIHGAVAGSLINTGQDCTAATRAYVQRALSSLVILGWRGNGEPTPVRPLLAPLPALAKKSGAAP